MLLNLVEYHWAEHIDDALLLLARLDVKTVPLAGGTYLLALQDDSIEAVVDLRDLELSYVVEDVRAMRIGAMTTLQQIVDTPLTKDYAMGVLAKAAQFSVASQLVRNSATLGGTLGAGIASQADLRTALVAFDAEVVVRSGSKTQVNLSGGTAERPGLSLASVVYKGKQERRLACSALSEERRPSELMIEIILPRLSYSTGAAFQRIARTVSDCALLNVAAVVEFDGGVCQKARLVFGGLNMEPMRVLAAERQLEGQTLDVLAEEAQLITFLRNGLVEFRPPADPQASSGYRRTCSVPLAYHALSEAIQVARWRGIMTNQSSNTGNLERERA